MNLFCPWDAPTYLIFSSNIPTLLYYSHLLAIIGALIFGILLFSKSRKELFVKIFIVNICLFTIWIVLDVLIWASNQIDIVLFYWGLVIIVEVLTYATAFYFSYVFANKRDMPFWLKVFCSILVLPMFIYLPTTSFLASVDISTCNVHENPLINNLTTYAVEIAFSVMIVFVILKALVGKSREDKRQLLLFLLGILIFLISFSSGNIIGSVTEDWDLAQFGVFGMPIFIGFLTYLAVRFKTFDLKVFTAQALVVGLVLLIGSEFLFVTTTVNRTLVTITFFLVCIGGYYLIKSVKNEIKAKEDLQVANVQLIELNKQKSEFVSFASHQLRSPLTSIIGNSSLILEGDAGPVSEPVKNIIKTIMEATKTQINVVESYLNSSRIELGTMKYSLIDMDFKDLTDQVMAEQKPNIEAKGLTHTLTIDESQSYKIKADPDKFKQVLMNIVDNSLKYTAKGSVNVSLVKDATKGLITFKVSDTGVGIRPDVMPKLFQKFSRAENANEANIHGTGLGLFIARDIVKAHGGRVWAESEGEGKGSQFYVEVPEAK